MEDHPLIQILVIASFIAPTIAGIFSIHALNVFLKNIKEINQNIESMNRFTHRTLSSFVQQEKK